MWEGWKDIWTQHRGKILGATFGLVASLMIMLFGFLWSVFIALSVLIGYLIGKRVDEDQGSILDVLERFLPPGHR